MIAAQSQAWLTVAGLSLDFLGFCLLLREWWIAFYSEASMMAHDEALERQQKLRALAAQNSNPAMQRHFAVTGQMQDDMAVRQAREERRSVQRDRK